MKRTFLALLAVCVFAAYSWADIRIRFARGRTSATVTGRVASGRTRLLCCRRAAGPSSVRNPKFVHR